MQIHSCQFFLGTCVTTSHFERGEFILEKKNNERSIARNSINARVLQMIVFIQNCYLVRSTKIYKVENCSEIIKKIKLQMQSSYI